MFRARWFSAGVSCLPIIMGMGATNPASAQDSLRYEYAVKIICGAPTRPAVAPGNYFTAINIHNPGRGMAFRNKFALTDSMETSVPPTPFRPYGLKTDFALEIDCAHRDLRDRRFVKGFAVIQTPRLVDVVPVYTVLGGDKAVGIALERVPPRKIAPVPFTAVPF